MSNLRLLNVSDIMALNPCYNPVETGELPDGWTGTVIDLLNNTATRPIDRLWVVRRLVDDKTNRLFAVKCARSALNRVGNPDPRSIAACDVAERYALGHAMAYELAAAYDAAYAAAYAAYVAVYAAAYTAAAYAAAHAADDAYAAAAYTAAAYAARVAEHENQINFYLELLGNDNA